MKPGQLMEPVKDRILLADLSRQIPKRALTRRESAMIAERIATKLRGDAGALAPRLDDKVIASLPWIVEVERIDDLPKSGMASAVSGGWVITLNDDEPEVRQRFSLAHELFHTIVDEWAQRLLPSRGGYTADERLEQMCDRFAAALLAPRVMLRADWASGMQSVPKLAARYGVSKVAMRVRLLELGLLEQTPRCDRTEAR